ncbi:hypothetical protein ACH4WW_30820 [Streptomyces halstedii]|uniref:hypothetical protein n=1 Tax=Streptomyces halstedii TaxID=1944 RepID=UPI0037AA225B
MNDVLDCRLDDLAPANAASAEAVERFRSGDLTALVQHHTTPNHAHIFVPCETWTLTRDPRADQAPVRVFHEEWDHCAGTYTMREGAFADVGAACSWLDNHGGPLPEPPEYGDHNGAAVRARVAPAQSTGVAAVPKAGLDASPTPPAAPVQRPVQGRLL